MQKPVTVVNQGSPNSISKNLNIGATLKFYDKWHGEASKRSKADFLIVLVLLKALLSKDWKSLRSGLDRFPLALPHFGAIARFVAGVLIRE